MSWYRSFFFSFFSFFFWNKFEREIVELFLSSIKPSKKKEEIRRLGFLLRGILSLPRKEKKVRFVGWEAGLISILQLMRERGRRKRRRRVSSAFQSFSFVVKWNRPSLCFRVHADQWTGNRDNNKIEKEPCSLPNFDRLDCFTSLLYRIWIKFRSEKAYFHRTTVARPNLLIYLLIYCIQIKMCTKILLAPIDKVHKLSYVTFEWRWRWSSTRI